MAKKVAPSAACPCYSGNAYKDCCQPLHKGRAAASAESLMRSRYAAYALSNIGYIVRTTHPDNPRRQLDTVRWRKELKQFAQMTEFAGLHILSSQDVSLTEATVRFRAILKQNGKDASFEEHSTFEKVKGQWLYLSAID